MIIKRIQSLLIIVAIAVSLLPHAVSADSSFGVWEFTLRVDDAVTLERLEYLGSRTTRALFDESADNLSFRYTMRWLTSNGVLSDRQRISFISGTRSIPDHSAGCTVNGEGTDLIVFRAEGPRSLTHIRGVRLSERHDEKFRASLATSEHKRFAQSFAKNRLIRTKRAAVQYPVRGLMTGSLQMIHGDSSPNKYRIAILSEGYQAHELSKFFEDASTISTHLVSHDPWKEMASAVSIAAIGVASTQSGADIPPEGVNVDTLFNASYWTNGLERLLAVNADGMKKARNIADQFLGVGNWDQLVILVNSKKYGGSGGSMVVLAAHEESAHILSHELGHSFAGLADEYSSEYPGYPFSTDEPNVDVDAQQPKWAAWITPGVSLPTLSEHSDSAVVGAFEGAKYHKEGIYRPSSTCGMRTLGDGLCPICREAHVSSLTERVSFLQYLIPNTKNKIKVGKKGGTISVTSDSHFSNLLTYQWYACEKLLIGETAPQLSFTKRQVSKKSCEIALEVTYHSPLVRSHRLTQRFAWGVAQKGKTRASKNQ